MRAGLGLLALVAAAAVIVSGGSGVDPRTPPALPGLPPPFLGTAVVGSGGRTAAVDAYGNLVDLRAGGPAGEAVVAVRAARQAAGSVPTGTAIVARVRLDDGRTLPLWRADSVRQRYLPGTNVLRTVAHFGPARIEIDHAIRGERLTCGVAAPEGVIVDPLSHECPKASIGDAARADRRWIGRARPLGGGAPGWARRMYERSLLVLRALTDRRTGAVAAGARDGWAYVWPRDAGAVAIALASAGYRHEARRVARFLLGLDLDAAARFRGDGAPVDGRAAQGDAVGWVRAAARAVRLPMASLTDRENEPTGGATAARPAWKGRADYQEGEAGAYLGNAIASGAPISVDGPKTSIFRTESAHRRGDGWIRASFGAPRGLVRRAGDPDSGIDSAAAWAVRPFPHPALFPAVRESLHRLLERESRFGIVPSEDWPGKDPWTAPTAWTAWGLAALAGDGGAPLRGHAARRHRLGALRDRRAALRLMADLRRAATPAGLLPERVDARTGAPRSTTPLAWSHAFAILALRELWPREHA